MGRLDYKRAEHLQKQSWNRRLINGLIKITYVFWIVHLSCDPVLDKVGSPPAHRQQSIQQNLTRIRATALHCLQKLIEHFEVFVFRFELPVLFQRR